MMPQGSPTALCVIHAFEFQPFESRRGRDTVIGLRFPFNAAIAATLKEHFGNELEIARTRIDAQVTRALVRNAIGGPNNPGNVTAQIFYLKTQRGWSEKVIVAHEGRIDSNVGSDAQDEGAEGQQHEAQEGEAAGDQVQNPSHGGHPGAVHCGLLRIRHPPDTTGYRAA